MSENGDKGATAPPGRVTLPEIDEETLRCYLRDARKRCLLARGIKEVIKALIRFAADPFYHYPSDR